MKKTVCLFSLIAAFHLSIAARNTDDQNFEQRLKTYIEQHAPDTGMGRSTLLSCKTDSTEATVRVYASKAFGSMVYTTLLRDKIYKDIRQILPDSLQSYKLFVYAGNQLIDTLVPNLYRVDKDATRMWNDIDYTGRPWVTDVSRPYTITRGLFNRHISLWASHGAYYSNNDRKWEWQRPPLYGTREDFLSQTFVIPYIIPMLENAGAVVFTPRERDWQPHEAVVDNDTPEKEGTYKETSYGSNVWSTTIKPGFAHKYQIYFNNMNPFEDGTARSVSTVTSKDNVSTAEWQPDIPAEGNYAVYVSYQTLYNSVDDAFYTVYHEGGATSFKVNQQMGGGTWVYLGTFTFPKGHSAQAKVVLSNYSRTHSGVVTADAVRFGGGMGNIARGSSPETARTSGMPRYLEGARYYTQWAGMPYNVYSAYDGQNDYKDDINARSYMTNYLAGGSPYLKTVQGLNVPLEVSLAFHTDAGFHRNDNLIGSLGICTTVNKDTGNDRLPSGISRMASRDLADIILTGLHRDLKNRCGINWNIRGIKDDDYSESFRPQIPAVIVEMLSHQNFADMKYANDPDFKFIMGRSIYKSILEYVTSQHGLPCTVQPLPVRNFAAALVNGKSAVQLSWTPQKDKDEPTAVPTGYVVYTRTGNGGFDNGQFVRETSVILPIDENKIYSFKVTAVNKGGESFPSEVLSACHVPGDKSTVLIVNGFHRLSAPASIRNDNQQGFDLKADPGVAYIKTTGWCGYQQVFDRKTEGRISPSGTGYTDSSLENKIIAGNSFDYPYIHGKALKALGYSFVSCSDEAVKNRRVLLTGYKMVDWIAGLQKYDKSGIIAYECFSPAARRAISQYAQHGGRFFLSGAYIGSGLTGEQEKTFTQTVLKYTGREAVPVSNFTTLSGNGVTFAVNKTLNDSIYCLTTSDELVPEAPAFTTFSYSNDSVSSASAAYLGTKFNCFSLGVPFESISSEGQRKEVMQTVIEFLFRKTGRPVAETRK